MGVNELHDNDYIDAVLAGKLDPHLVLWGYSRGIFPMGDPDSDRIDWYAPDPRGIIDLDRFHVPRNLRPLLASAAFRVTVNQAFDRVIRGCANRRQTWITETIIDCYTELHALGHAHSVEVWHGPDLAGGLYGVAIGGAFFGESMFHVRAHASKVALAALVRQMKRQGFLLLDIQFITAHLARFGAVAIPREEYLQRLGRALRKECAFLRPGQQTIELTATKDGC